MPLTVVVALLTSASAFWLLALVAPVWLIRQAVQTYVEADEMLLSAVRHEVIESSTVSFIDSLVPQGERPS